MFDQRNRGKIKRFKLGELNWVYLHTKLSTGLEKKMLLLYVPACSTATYGNRLFTVETATLWNDLPQEVRDAANVQKTAQNSLF